MTYRRIARTNARKRISIHIMLLELETAREALSYPFLSKLMTDFF